MHYSKGGPPHPSSRENTIGRGGGGGGGGHGGVGGHHSHHDGHGHPHNHYGVPPQPQYGHRQVACTVVSLTHCPFSC